MSPRRFVIASVLVASSLVAASSRAADDPTRDDANPPRPHFALRADGGATFRSLYGIDVGAVSLGAAALADTRAGSYGGGLFGVFGQTEEGLRASHWGFTAEASWTFAERIRLGVLPRFGWLEVDKFTDSAPAEGTTLGLAGRIGVDVLRERGFTLALGVEPAFDTTVELYSHEGSGLFMPSMGAYLQVRYRFARDGGPK